MPRPSSSFRLIGLVAIALVFLVGDSNPSNAQEAPDTASMLARYVPKENVIFYIEYQGLDAHAEAWKKTAAYKILNNTKTGVMLEDLAVQLISKIPGKDPKVPRSGADSVAIIKHLVHNGFVWAVVSDPKSPKKYSDMRVLRNAFKDKATRGIVAGWLQKLNAPNTKPQQVVRLGHKLVTGVMDASNGGIGFAWWVEESRKEDIILVNPAPESADVFLETIDGKTANASTDAHRNELLKTQNGFSPNGIIYYNVELQKTNEKLSGLKIPLAITKLDFQWGFQGDALMTVTKIGTSSPREGALAILDGPSFSKDKLTTIPENVGEFTVVALDPNTTLKNVVALAKTFKPDIETQLNTFIDSVKTTTKLRLKEDILVHIGPRMAFYTLPTKAGSKPAAAATGLVGTIMSSMGVDQVPRAALVFDIDDAAAFGKVLDQVMAAVNKELKASASKAAGGEAAPAKGARGKAASAPSPEFRLMPGDAKMFVLSVPSELSSQYPSTIRPAIRVVGKQAVIAVTSEVARLVLETKTNWKTPSDLAPAFEGLSSNLKVLNLSDPRDSLPELLASLPGQLQRSINTALQFKATGKFDVAGATSATAGSPTAPSGNFKKKIGAFSLGGDSEPAPGGDAGKTAAASPPANPGDSNIILKVDAAKMPTADSVKALLFPSVFSIESTETEIRIVSRSAFPSLPDMTKLFGLAQVSGLSSVLSGLMPTPPAGAAPAGDAKGAAPPAPAAPAPANPGGVRGRGRL